MGLQHTFDSQKVSTVRMKVYIVSKKDPEWVLVCTLIRENAAKYFVWSNDTLTIEMHFPKESYYMTCRI